MSLPIVKNESSPALLCLKNRNPVETKIEAMSIICSHPNLFGFRAMELDPCQTDFKLTFKATMIGMLNVKFLIRYTVSCKDQEIENGSKYRFKRIELNLFIQDAFEFKPTFH